MTSTDESRSKILRLDNTKRSCASTCLRKYYWQYERSIKPVTGSTALRYGITWHAAMDAFYTYTAENGWKRDGKALEMAILTAKTEWEQYTNGQIFYDDYRTLSNLVQALLVYMDRFAGDEGMLKIIESEHTFEIPMYLPNPVFNGAFQTEPYFYFTGMIDLEVELNDRPWIIDHKTTGKSISQASSQLRRAAQFIGYTFAAGEELPIKPDGFLIVFHYLSAYKSKSTGEYGKPKIDFDRIPELYTPYDVEQWKLSLYKAAKDIYSCIENNIWPMNFDNCYQFGRCAFCNLCEQQRPIEDVLLHDFIVDKPWDVVAETKIRQQRREEMLKGIS
jgi:hypothetical protein